MAEHKPYNVLLVNSRGIHHHRCATKVEVILSVLRPGVKKAVVTSVNWKGCLRVLMGAHETPGRIDSLMVGWNNDPIPDDAKLLNKLLLN